MRQRCLYIVLFVGLAATAALCGPAWGARGELVPDDVLARQGLMRPWFAQVQLDRARSHLEEVILYEGVLYAQTNAAVVDAIDAETGRTLWSRRIGESDRISMTPDANGDRLAVVNGSWLYVVNRFTGEAIYDTEIKDAPGAGPAVSSQRVYVPMVTGMVVAYPLTPAAEKPSPAAAAKNQTPEERIKAEIERRRSGTTPMQAHLTPLFCRSYGRAMVQPLLTRDNIGGEYVVWPTDRGYLNLARIDREAENTALVLKYRLTTGAAIVARPGYQPPDPKVTGDSGTVFAASGDGLVYAVAEETGTTLWRFTTGEPLVQAPAVIDDRVYVPTQLGGMYALDAKTGKSLWWTLGVVQFVAAGKERVYGIDRLGRLAVVASANGARLGTIATEGVSTKLANTDTDRIYLVSQSGLIQCLREAEQVQPLAHGKERKEAAKAKPPEPKAEDEKPAKKEPAVTPKTPAKPEKKPAAKAPAKKK